MTTTSRQGLLKKTTFLDIVKGYNTDQLKAEINDILRKTSDMSEPTSLPDVSEEDPNFINTLKLCYNKWHDLFLEKLLKTPLVLKTTYKNYSTMTRVPEFILYACSENSLYIFMLLGIFQTPYVSLILDTQDLYDNYVIADKDEFMRAILYWYEISQELSLNTESLDINFVYKLFNVYGFDINFNSDITLKNLEYIYIVYTQNKEKDVNQFLQYMLNFLKLLQFPNYIEPIKQINEYEYCYMFKDGNLDMSKLFLDFYHKIDNKVGDNVGGYVVEGYTSYDLGCLSGPNKLNKKIVIKCRLYSAMFMTYIYACSKILIFLIRTLGVTDDIKLVIDSFPDGLWAPFSSCLNIPQDVNEKIMRYRSDIKYSKNQMIPQSLRPLASSISYSSKRLKSTYNRGGKSKRIKSKRIKSKRAKM
jgi:hypothetical protein